VMWGGTGVAPGWATGGTGVRRRCHLGATWVSPRTPLGHHVDKANSRPSSPVELDDTYGMKKRLKNSTLSKAVQKAVASAPVLTTDQREVLRTSLVAPRCRPARVPARGSQPAVP
jgi:hypothetical protein